MSFGKGGGKTSTNTVTQDTTPWNSSYLGTLYDTAGDVYRNNYVKYYPNDTLYIDPNLTTGYQTLYQKGSALSDTGSIVDEGNNALLGTLKGYMSGYYSPAYSDLTNIAQGGTDLQGKTSDLEDSLSYLGGGSGKYNDTLSQLSSDVNQYNPGTSYLTDIAGGKTWSDNPAYQGLGYYSSLNSVSSNPANEDLDYYSSGKFGDYNPGTGPLEDVATDKYIKDSPTKDYYNSVLSGDYLNSNPYLDDMYDAAADSVTRSYQTATAPDTESKYELAGRYGSGVMTNEKTQNRLDLGESLDKLASDIYGKDYENERGLQNTAASDYGSQYNTAADIGAKAAGTLSSEYNKSIDTAATAAANRGSQYNDAVDTAAKAAGTYGSLYNTAGDRAADAATTLGSQYYTGLGVMSDAATSGLGSQIDALKDAGTLASSDLGYRLSALDKLQTGFDTGNANTLKGLSLVPDQAEATTYGANQMIKGATGTSAIGQSEIQDAMDRYYGLAEEPWKNLSNYAELLGSPTSAGTTTTKSPIYSNTGASVLGTGLATAGLLGQTGAFGGSGWLTSLLGGGAADTAATTGAGSLLGGWGWLAGL